MSAYIHLPHRILLRTGTLAVIRAVHRAYTQRAVPHRPARHHVDTVSAGHPRDLVVWKLARRLVAQRAVLVIGAADDGDDEFADLYVVKWTSLMIPPLAIIMVNLIAIAVGVSRTIYNVIPQWSKLVGRVVLQLLVPCSSLPVCKRMPTMVYLWSGLIVITISLLWVKAISPPSANSQIGGSDTSDLVYR
ncbi:hypothetical protein B296_00007539 [Ensete ventricosum]|uniref:Uncharacterized protein n=1 Tax=Ensete ventricosum TaxID=4639 RepID=A0A426ZZY3_ENSVE|nr:hypothetical protein B296_00007539 [Ensete ventricosum]